jgi:hypothetical protein
MMLDDTPMLEGLAWIKKGFTAEDGSLDDARFNGALLVASFIIFAFYVIHESPPKDILGVAEAIKAFGIGSAAMAAGIGGWFKLRGGN